MPTALSRALKAAKQIYDVDDRANALFGLVPITIKQYSSSQLVEVWQANLKCFVTNRRSDLLKGMEVLMPIAIELAGKEAVVAVAQEIQRVGGWWP